MDSEKDVQEMPTGRQRREAKRREQEKKRQMMMRVAMGIFGMLCFIVIQLMFQESEPSEQDLANGSMTLVILNGYTTKQIAEKVEEIGIATAEDFIKETKANDFEYTFLEWGVNRVYPLEGYLLPGTYEFAEETTAREVIEEMLGAFHELYQKELLHAMNESGNRYTLDEYVMMASMIEKEIHLDEERAKLSSVLHSCLRYGRFFELESTVLYGMGLLYDEVISADITVESPYNTYINKGFPQGPVSNPSITSLLTAITPDETEYLYFLPELENEVYHLFFETKEGYEKAKAVYEAS